MESTKTAPADLRALGFMLPEELAALVNKKPRTLANDRAKGRGPAFVRVHGRLVVYPIDAVHKWLRSRAVGTVDQPEPFATPQGRTRANRAA